MWLLVHTAGALLLAMLALVLGRWGRLSPAARHALWLLVLLKLLMPPFVSWPWPLPLLPTDRPDAAEPAGKDTLIGEEPGGALVDLHAVLSQGEPRDMPLSLPPAEESAIPPVVPMNNERPAVRWDRLAELAAAIWFCGAVAATFVQLRRLGHIGRWLGHARPAPPRLVVQVEELASALGVRPPRLAVLPGLGSPFVWAGGRARLLWPEGLEGQLSPEGCRAVLAHELAHLARRDHWVGWLLLVAGCLWWWHPLFYLVRRQLNLHAELACDARTVAVLPDARRSYAEALLDVCQRQTWTAAAPVLGASGRRRDLERRLVMIMRANVPSRLSPRLLVGVGFLGLVLLPAWTLGQVKTTDKTAPGDRDKQLQSLEQRLQDLLKDLEAQRKTAPATDSAPATAKPADRDKKIQELEAKVKALLKEVQTLRKGNPLPAALDVAFPVIADPNNPVNSVLFEQLMGDVVVGQPATTAPVEVALSRTTYKLPAAKAEAFGKFLQEHVKTVVMETKVEGDHLTVTTTPEVQRGIGQFIALIEGRTPQRTRDDSWRRLAK